MMMPHRVHSVHHTDKLLPYGTAKESSICKMCCSRGTQRTHTDVFRTPEKGHIFFDQTGRRGDVL